ncbi:hypothetical protein KGP36_02905 [Patescibacteria group bacterium]|nr:hypothetical protein [Patescibacteria group bacterium]
MARVRHVQRHYRTQFRRLAFGEAFWFSTNLATAPSIKLNRTQYINGWNASPDGSAAVSTASDTSVAVVRVPGNFLGQNRTLS